MFLCPGVSTSGLFIRFTGTRKESRSGYCRFDPMKAFTLYFYSQSGSCITYFGVDGRSKARALKMGKEIAKVMLAYYKAGRMPWLTKVAVDAEEYKR